MRNTQQIRNAWSPACRSHKVSLLPAYRAIDIVMQRWGYGPRSGETWGYNCRRITGGSGYSLHAFDPGERFIFWTGVAVTTAIAVDINSLANPYGPRLVTDMPRGMVTEILSIKTVDGVQVFKWGGYYSKNKDAMHFEIQASPAELARGIVMPRLGEEDDMFEDKDREKLDAIVDATRAGGSSIKATPLDRYINGQHQAILAAIGTLASEDKQRDMKALTLLTELAENPPDGVGGPDAQAFVEAFLEQLTERLKG